MPSDNLLQDIKSEKENTEDINRKKELIVKTLLEHGIEVSVDQVKSGHQLLCMAFHQVMEIQKE